MPMRIAIASDHAGYALKEELKRFVRDLGHEVRDFGTHGTDAVDYPDFVVPAAEAVARGECDLGILLGGSGNGEAMAANKVPGVRCAVCWESYTARVARAHNDANMIALGARVIGPELAREVVRSWLEARYEGGRHDRRLAKLRAVEEKYARG